MGEQILFSRIEPDEHEAHRMANRYKHGAEQDGHIITISSSQFDHPSRRVQQLDTIDVTCVTYIAFHPLKERTNFTQIIFGPDTALPQKTDGRLSHAKVSRAGSDQICNQLDSLDGSRISFGYAADKDPGLS